MTNLFTQFQEFRKILCVCPCCGELVRVSDLHLKVKGPVTRTWLDDYQKRIAKLLRREERFEDLEMKIRERALKRGKQQAERVIRRAIIPVFKTMRLDPLDIKPIFNPVYYIAFKGMNKQKRISDIILLSKRCENQSLNEIRTQIDKAIDHERYTWQVARIDEKGSIEFEI